MTSDGEALFRAICEQPWEDTPRLVYADWLEENGDSLRAAYIHHSVALIALKQVLWLPSQLSPTAVRALRQKFLDYTGAPAG